MNIKLRAGGYMVPCEIEFVKERISIKFPYNKSLLNEIKLMRGAKWDPEQKLWSVAACTRNLFQLTYLQGENPYSRWDDTRTIAEMRASLVLRDGWKPYDHQIRMAATAAHARRTIIAGDMGTGKTLAAFMATETVLRDLNLLNTAKVWYIGPKSGCRAVGLEVLKWDTSFGSKMRFITYEQLVKVMDTEPMTGDEVPRVVLFDESSKVKTDTAKRSQAAKTLERRVTATHGWDSLIVLMTGTPAPRCPVDWYNQCEIAQEGFLREGDKYKFRNRLSVQKDMKGMGGVTFSTLVTWLDSESKCAVCGQVEAHFNHRAQQCAEARAKAAARVAEGLQHIGFKTSNAVPELQVSAVKDTQDSEIHTFQRSVNEVARLYKRLEGLVITVKKEDCLNLPKKIYIDRVIKPTVEMLKLAIAARAKAPSAITLLSYMRELSDGFQYADETTGNKVPCTQCSGTKTVNEYSPKVTLTGEDLHGADLDHVSGSDIEWVTSTIECPTCEGTGQCNEIHRVAHEIGTPKDEALEDDLESLEESGRAIIWAGFQASVDRCVNICLKNGWTVLRIDGRGFHVLRPAADAKGQNPIFGNHKNEAKELVTEALTAMDYSHRDRDTLLDRWPKLAVVGNPKAGGMALTFTAASTAIYYSNGFDGEARMQSEDRHHRAGMDSTRPAVVIDYLCLPADRIVKENLLAKKRLQDMTTIELSKLLAQAATV